MKRALLCGAVAITVVAIAFAVMAASAPEGGTTAASAQPHQEGGSIFIQGGWGDAPGEFGLREERGMLFGPETFAGGPPRTRLYR